MKTSNIILLGIAFIVIIAIGAIAGSGGSSGGSAGQQGRAKAKYKFTLYAAPQITSIMIDYIIYTNENYLNETAQIYFSDLPKSFNFGEDETLSFEIITKSGYTLNYWLPDNGRPDHNNPVHYPVSEDFTLTIYLKRTHNTTP